VLNYYDDYYFYSQLKRRLKEEGIEIEKVLSGGEDVSQSERMGLSEANNKF
jgi:hypothetical protein